MDNGTVQPQAAPTPSGGNKPETTTPTVRLRQLLARKDHVLAIMHPQTAAFARIMEQAGCEVGFVGTGQVVGGYTGLTDVGTATMTECVQIGGWIAQSVSMPIILDGDTGHGGIMAVRRFVRECIRAGIAGIRLDDQPIEGKRRTGTAGYAGGGGGTAAETAPTSRPPATPPNPRVSTRWKSQSCALPSVAVSV